LQRREPIFNVPGVVLCLLGVLLAVELLRRALPPEGDVWLTEAMAFIPGRLGGDAVLLPGGQVAMATAFLTHVFVHGDLTHLLVNSAWLLAIGSPVARRIDAARFLAFFFFAGAAGALAYLAVNGGVLVPVVGASGAISGLMGASFRFLFRGPTKGIALGEATVPLTSLLETLQDRRVLIAIAIWTMLNALQALGAAGITDAAGIAWEAHLGGFFAGLLLYGFFEPSPPLADPAADDAANAC
jgi:membrane associated rhomboid family serine protease